MNETIAALQKCVVEIRRERMDVRSPFGRVLQNTHVEVPPRIRRPCHLSAQGLASADTPALFCLIELPGS